MLGASPKSFLFVALASFGVAGMAAGQQPLVGFGTGSLAVDPGATYASYSQNSAGLTFSPSVALGDTLGGGFSARNWSDAGFQTFGVIMSVTGGNPNLPFTVEVFDARAGDFVAALTGNTAGVGTNPVFVPLTFTTGSRAQLTNAVGLQFTWDGAGNIQAAISSLAVRSTVPPPPPPVKKKQTITFTQPAQQVFSPGKTFALSARTDSGQPVRFISSNTNVLSISKNVATIRRAGPVTITATNKGNSNYFPAHLARTVNIAKAAQTIPPFRSTSNVSYGTKLTFSNTRTTPAKRPVRFRVVSGPAKITNNVLTVTGVGRVTVEASESGNANYRAARAQTNSFQTVKAGQSIKFNLPATRAFQKNAIIPLGGTTRSKLPITYTSSRPGVVAISGTKAVIKGRGRATITAIQKGNRFYKAARPVSSTIKIK